MRLIEPVSADVMVAAFLQAEIDSARFGSAILLLLAREGLNRRVIDSPDTRNAEENAARERLLGEWRGYGRNQDVFTDLPEDTEWFRAALEENDLARLMYINDEYWTELSGGSRLVRDAAERIRSGAAEGDPAARYRAFADAMDQGATFVTPIVLHNPKTDELVILEGHLRITACMLSTQRSAELSVILGRSNNIQK